jgi:cytidylate kinase
MTIVMISSMYQSGREELAQVLARKTGWPVLSREELVDEARKLGIKMGRLEVAMIKTPGLSEKLVREKELYLAFLTATLCEKAHQGDFIYHGRAGHLLLPGVTHRLRVGLTAPQEIRIKRTAQALNLTSDKAETYLTQLDEDVGKWIRYMHRVDGRDPSHFDLFFNLENMGLSNAAGILCATAELPDFQVTPASLKLLNDLNLSAQAKLRLALDERTLQVDLQVHADNGVITVTYPPDQDQASQYIPQVLAELPGCREIQCTMAETNILWVQERFEPESENFGQIIRLSQRWGAAVELMRLIPPGELPDDAEAFRGGPDYGYARQECSLAADGGVQDDDPQTVTDDGGLGRTEEELVDLGRFGGRYTVCGGYDQILDRVQASGRYTLVVIGDMFMSKGHSARTRQTRELALNIRDRLKAPVITGDELKSQLLFGKRQAATLVGYLALTILVYVLVFTNQKPILDFLGGPLHQDFKVSAAVAVTLFSPLLAYVFGSVSGLALKIINVD